jgi:uncharacterized protein YbjT (DUF2867 family)
MILLTGASGTIGRHLVSVLKAKDVPFKVALRDPGKGARLGAQAVAFDWDQPRTFAPALEAVDTLFLLTPTTETQVKQSQGLVEAAKAAGVKRVVKLSVSGADSEPGIALGRMHRESERAVQAAGFAWTMLRPTFFMQNFVSFYGVTLDADSTIYLPNGDAKVAWLDARDIGDVAAHVLTSKGHENKAYELTGDEPLSTAEACALLSAALGHKVTYVDVPEQAAREGMQSQGIPPWYVESLLELNMVIRNGWAAQIATGVHEVLGRSPRRFAAFAADLARREK